MQYIFLRGLDRLMYPCYPFDVKDDAQPNPSHQEGGLKGKHKSLWYKENLVWWTARRKRIWTFVIVLTSPVLERASVATAFAIIWGCVSCRAVVFRRRPRQLMIVLLNTLPGWYRRSGFSCRFTAVPGQVKYGNGKLVLCYQDIIKPADYRAHHKWAFEPYLVRYGPSYGLRQVRII